MNCLVVTTKLTKLFAWDRDVFPGFEMVAPLQHKAHLFVSIYSFFLIC